jgi:hypothetical protein
MPECRVCLGACNREIHDATLRVREWFRGQVMPAPYVAPSKKKGVPPKPERPTVRRAIGGRPW